MGKNTMRQSLRRLSTKSSMFQSETRPQSPPNIVPKDSNNNIISYEQSKFTNTNINFDQVLSGQLYFEDMEFRPDTTCLFQPGVSLMTQEDKQEWVDRIQFERISVIQKQLNLKSKSIFGDGVELKDDIIQGNIGNCYFISAINSILEDDPERIKRIFINQEINEVGIYGVRLWLDGKQYNIYVDDFIPFYKGTKNPCFTRSKSGTAFWMCILDKAWAKVHGSFENIVSESVANAYLALTGAPIHNISVSTEKQKLKRALVTEKALSDQLQEPDIFKTNVDQNSQDQNKQKESELYDQIWSKLKKGYEQNQKLCCATAKEDDGEIQYDPVGLVRNHAYSILGLYELDDTNLNSGITKMFINLGMTFLKSEKLAPCRLIKIKNPWGRKTWSGDWSNSSQRWVLANGKPNTTLLKKLCHQIRDDGIFFMELSDFLKYFVSMTLCKYNKFYQQRTLMIDLNPNINPLFTRTKLIQNFAIKQDILQYTFLFVCLLFLELKLLYFILSSLLFQFQQQQVIQNQLTFESIKSNKVLNKSLHFVNYSLIYFPQYLPSFAAFLLPLFYWMFEDPNKKFSFVKIILHADMNKTSFFVQQNYRKFKSKEEQSQDEYQYLNMILVKGDIQNYCNIQIENYIEGQLGNQVITEMELDLKKGSYLMYIDLQKDENEISFTLGSYSQNTIQMTEIQPGMINEKLLLEKIFKQHAFQSQKQPVYKDKGYGNIETMVGKFNDLGCGFTYLYAQNREILQNSAILTQRIIFQNLKGLKPFNFQFIVNQEKVISVGPQEQNILILKQVEKECDTSYSYYSYIKPMPQNKSQLVKQKGTKQKIEYLNFDYPIYVITFTHDHGFDILFTNETQNFQLKIKANFTLENVKLLEKGQDPKNLKFILGPGQEQLFQFQKKFLFDECNFLYSYTPKCEEIIQGEVNLIKFIQKNPNKVYQLMDQKGCVVVKIFQLTHNEEHLFLFQNTSSALQKPYFKVTSVNDNLEMLDDQGNNEWFIDLKPKSEILKRIRIIDDEKDCQISYSYRC